MMQIDRSELLRINPIPGDKKQKYCFYIYNNKKFRRTPNSLFGKQRKQFSNGVEYYECASKEKGCNSTIVIYLNCFVFNDLNELGVSHDKGISLKMNQQLFIRLKKDNETLLKTAESLRLNENYLSTGNSLKALVQFGE